MSEPMHPYQRVTTELRRRIRAGEFAPGARFPSRRELCIEYDVSDIVIGRVIPALKAEGLIITLPGTGTFVADPLPPEP